MTAARRGFLHGLSMALLFVTGGLTAVHTAFAADFAPPLAPPVSEVIKANRSSRGLCLLFGEGAGEYALELARQSQWTILLQSPSAEDVAESRRLAHQSGLLGTRITVVQGTADHLQLADNLADVAVVTNPAREHPQVPPAELERAVHPGGVIFDGEAVRRIPTDNLTDDWTHPYHSPDNNPVSLDQRAQAPFLTRFLAKPYYGPMPEVTVIAGGRIFKAFGHISFREREWPSLHKLICLNAYNGTLMWERDLKQGFMIHRNTMIATPDALFLADDESCKVIDAASGEVRDEIVLPERIAEGRCWKWMALEGGILYALLGEAEPADEVLRGVRTIPGWPWNELGELYARKDYPWGFGKTLVAIDPKTKEILWSRTNATPWDSRAVCMKSRRIFAYSHPHALTAIDASTGDTYWETNAPELLAAIGEHDPAQTWKKGYSSQVYLKCSNRMLFFAGPQRTKLAAVSADDGHLAWTYPDGNMQLVLHDDAVYAMGKLSASKKLDPLTGEVLADLPCLRGNCTRATGTIDSVFTRGDQHGGTMWLNLEGETPKRIPAMRPGCHDGVIAANGLLYWGPWMCDCNHSLIGLICLGPAGNFDFAESAPTPDRLQQFPSTSKTPSPPLSVTSRDWPTYRQNNTRTAHTPVAVPNAVEQKWIYSPIQPAEPTAPVSVGDRLFVGYANGVVQSLDAVTGTVAWTAYTGGSIAYPPAIAAGKVYVGSADGWIDVFDAVGGNRVWRFQAAPETRMIPVYGTMSSTWPVTSGVLVEAGVAYAAAGIANHDGTYIYALNADDGSLIWQNSSSGRLMGDEYLAGVSVQGHLLMHNKTLYLAGGNVVSPAMYDVRTGKCLNSLTNEWQKAPRGSELFLVEGSVRAVDRMFYSPREYMPSRYFAKYLLQASSKDVLIQGTETAMMRVEWPKLPPKTAEEKPQASPAASPQPGRPPQPKANPGKPKEPQPKVIW